jgi:hypothetical protein
MAVLRENDKTSLPKDQKTIVNQYVPCWRAKITNLALLSRFLAKLSVLPAAQY